MAKLAPPPPEESDEWLNRVRRWPEHLREFANAKASILLRRRDDERTKAAAGAPHDPIAAKASARWIRWSVYLGLRHDEEARAFEPLAGQEPSSNKVIDMLEAATRSLGQRVKEA